MHVPAVIFLAAALLCSLVGRILLMGAAFGISTVWGLSVLFVPFAPLAFRMKYRELAHPTRYWRMATGPLMLLFFVSGGSANSFHSLTDFNFQKPETAAIAPAKDNAPFHLPVPSKVVASISGHTEGAAATPAPAATPAKADATFHLPMPSEWMASIFGHAAATPAPVATPAPKVPTLDERKLANSNEFARLAEWYDTLKHERGYLRKNDTEGVAAYNAEAAKYQAALQLARKEQADLAKLATALPGVGPIKPLAKQ